MDRSANYLFVRADGFAETPDGDIAVKMSAKGTVIPGTDPEAIRVRFAPSPAASSVLVEWERGAPISIFPEEISKSLLRLKLAVQPSAEDVTLFNENFAKIAEGIEKAAAEEKARAEAEAKVKADAEAKAKADAEAKAKAAEEANKTNK